MLSKILAYNTKTVQEICPGTHGKAEGPDPYTISLTSLLFNIIMFDPSRYYKETTELSFLILYFFHMILCAFYWASFSTSFQAYISRCKVFVNRLKDSILLPPKPFTAINSYPSLESNTLSVQNPLASTPHTNHLRLPRLPHRLSTTFAPPPLLTHPQNLTYTDPQ